MRDVSGMEFLLQVFDKDTMSKDDPLGEVKWNKLKHDPSNAFNLLLRSGFLWSILTSLRREPSGNICLNTQARWSLPARGRVQASRGAAPGPGPLLTRERTQPRARLALPPSITSCPTRGRCSLSPSSSARWALALSMKKSWIEDRALWLCKGFSNCVFRIYSLL